MTVRRHQRLLRLTLHRRYFAEIAARTKHTEYRERKPYWKSRLEGREYDAILFRNGYARNAPEMLVEFRGVRRSGKDYAIRLGRILQIKRWSGKGRRDRADRPLR
jgi:hypothetical protein